MQASEAIIYRGILKIDDLDEVAHNNVMISFGDYEDGQNSFVQTTIVIEGQLVMKSEGLGNQPQPIYTVYNIFQAVSNSNWEDDYGVLATTVYKIMTSPDIS